MRTDGTDEGLELLRQLLEYTRRNTGEIASLLASPAEAQRVYSILRPLAATAGITASETSINGSRVDITLTGPNDALWAVVLGRTPDGLVENVTVFERPAPFNGTPGGFVVCVSGASSSGKSTLMKALCEQATTPWTRFDEQSLGTTPMHFLIWPERSGPMTEGFFAAVREYARVGNQVILSLPARMARDYFGKMPHLFVHLDCPLDVLIARQAHRTDRWAGLAEKTFEQDRESKEYYDLRIDTARISPELAAETVLREVARVMGRK